MKQPGKVDSDIGTRDDRKKKDTVYVACNDDGKQNMVENGRDKR